MCWVSISERPKRSGPLARALSTQLKTLYHKNVTVLWNVTHGSESTQRHSQREVVRLSTKTGGKLFEYNNETSGFIKGGEFIDQLSDY